jgi:hypothetical protein
MILITLLLHQQASYRAVARHDKPRAGAPYTKQALIQQGPLAYITFLSPLRRREPG